LLIGLEGCGGHTKAHLRREEVAAVVADAPIRASFIDWQRLDGVYAEAHEMLDLIERVKKSAFAIAALRIWAGENADVELIDDQVIERWRTKALRCAICI